MCSSNKLYRNIILNKFIEGDVNYIYHYLKFMNYKYSHHSTGVVYSFRIDDCVWKDYFRMKESYHLALCITNSNCYRLWINKCTRDNPYSGPTIYDFDTTNKTSTHNKVERIHIQTFVDKLFRENNYMYNTL